MKSGLLICALLICALPADASAGGLPTEASRNTSKKVGAVSEQAGAAPARVKAFIHPQTGEILTYEQWRALGIADDQAGRGEPRNAPRELEGRRVDLENGDYVIIVDTPASGRIETKARFDENGKVHITCDH